MKLNCVLLLILIILIAGCVQTKQITGNVVGGDVSEKADPCSNIQCAAGEECINGTCSCKDGFKVCGDKCIAQRECCTDKDCGAYEFCNNNQCYFSCDKLNCYYNQVCDPLSRKCVCEEGALWCEFQQKCVKLGTCCDSYDCEGSKKCEKTIFSANICFEGAQRTCKYIGENSFTYFDLNGERHKFMVEKVYAKNEIRYSLNGDGLKKIKMGERVRLKPGVYIYFQDIKEVGGLCKY